MSRESNEMRPVTVSNDPPGSARGTPAPPPTAPGPVARIQGLDDTLLLTAFLLVLIGGVLGLVSGLQRIDDGRGNAEALHVVVVVLASVACSMAPFLLWQRRAEVGSIIAVVSGIVLLVLGPVTAGLLAVLGGVLALVALRLPKAYLPASRQT